MKLRVIIILSGFVLFSYSCVSTKFSENNFHTFIGKSTWTEAEKECCYKAISNLESADSTYIIFRKSKIKSMGQAQPLNRTILRKAENRIYIISVRDKSVNGNLNFETIPDSARIGLVGHEIVHVLDYKTMSFFQIISMGIKYSYCPNYKRQTEWKTDSLTIVNNMGYETLCFAHQIYNSPYLSKNYLKKKEKFYMKPEDILRIIKSLE